MLTNPVNPASRYAAHAHELLERLDGLHLSPPRETLQALQSMASKSHCMLQPRLQVLGGEFVSPFCISSSASEASIDSEDELAGIRQCQMHANTVEAGMCQQHNAGSLRLGDSASCMHATHAYSTLTDSVSSLRHVTPIGGIAVSPSDARTSNSKWSTLRDMLLQATPWRSPPRALPDITTSTALPQGTPWPRAAQETTPAMHVPHLQHHPGTTMSPLTFGSLCSLGNCREHSGNSMLAHPASGGGSSAGTHSGITVFPRTPKHAQCTPRAVGPLESATASYTTTVGTRSTPGHSESSLQSPVDQAWKDPGATTAPELCTPPEPLLAHMRGVNPVRSIRRMKARVGGASIAPPQARLRFSGHLIDLGSVVRRPGLSVEPDLSIERVFQLFNGMAARYLPVVDSAGWLRGIVTRKQMVLCQWNLDSHSYIDCTVDVRMRV